MMIGMLGEVISHWKVVSAVLLTACLAQLAAAESSGAKLWPRLEIGNEIYTGVVYKGHDASRVKFEHSTGLANIPISTLPSELQKRLNYDPTTAAENEARLAAEQQAVLQQLQANTAAARERNAASASPPDEPEEKDGMIRVLETEVIPPDEVQRLGISGLQRYRQPGESPLEQMDRESKTGVIRKVWKWVPKPEVNSSNASKICVFSVEYGRKGRLIEIIEDGKVYEVEYGRKGRLIEIIEDGKVYEVEYGRKGRLIEIIEDGKVYEVEYGRKGRLIEIMEGC